LHGRISAIQNRRGSEGKFRYVPNSSVSCGTLMPDGDSIVATGVVVSQLQSTVASSAINPTVADTRTMTACQSDRLRLLRFGACLSSCLSSVVTVSSRFPCLDPDLRRRLGGPELGTGVLQRLMREINAPTDIGGNRWSIPGLRDLLIVQTARLLHHPPGRRSSDGPPNRSGPAPPHSACRSSTVDDVTPTRHRAQKPGHARQYPGLCCHSHEWHIPQPQTSGISVKATVESVRRAGAIGR